LRKNIKSRWWMDVCPSSQMAPTQVGREDVRDRGIPKTQRRKFKTSRTCFFPSSRRKSTAHTLLCFPLHQWLSVGEIWPPKRHMRGILEVVTSRRGAWGAPGIKWVES
jgi:hypothetical protein